MARLYLCLGRNIAMTPLLVAMTVCIGVLLGLYAIQAINEDFRLRRFLKSSNAAITLYEEYFKEVLAKKFSVDKELIYVVSWGLKYNFEFVNTLEASLKYEEMIQEALADYDKLDQDMQYVLSNERHKLVQICSEIRTLRWEMQLE